MSIKKEPKKTEGSNSYKRINHTESSKRPNDQWLAGIKHKLAVNLLSLLVVALILGVGFAVYHMIQEKRADEFQAVVEAEKETAKAAMTEDEILKLYEQHKNNDSREETGTEESSVSEEATTEIATEEDVYESTIDFEGLWKVNKDVYAWITVPGTVIDYPILQHPTDNTYYLNYNIDGSYGYPGCIYTENLNSKDFTDANTVIYGHNMKNGSMFAGLHQFEDADFFDKNREVIIYTPEKEYHYTIFASYIYDDRHLLYSFDFSEEDVYGAYLDSIFSMRDLNAHIREDVEVNKKDRIITLVTCMSKQPSKRLLVQAVLNND